MTLLIAGLAGFFLVHLVPATSVKQTLINKIGQGGYMGVISIASLAAFVAIVRGYKAVPPTQSMQLWQPIEMAGTISLVVMPLACVLLAAAYVPCNIKRYIRHPLLTAFVLWSGVHLLANGDSTAALIFASFGIYSIWRRMAMPYAIGTPTPLWRDVVVIIAGAATFATLHYYHEALSGIGLPLLI
ncbi:MAG: hypothetical protein HAW65_06465 [Alphaproteobacteria bacterium]|nr:hypothetical protein [Alphaproteobacteria bacterium]